MTAFWGCAEPVQAPDPSQLGVNLLDQVANHFSAISPQVHTFPQPDQLLFAVLQISFPLFEDASTNGRFKHFEHSHSRDETRERGRIRFAELAQSRDQFPPSECGNRILQACLATLSRHSLLAHPALGGETAQQRIDQIVVHRALSKNETRLALQLVSMLWTVEQGSQNY